MKGQRLCLDRISALPPPIIETILCLLPIQEAGRTSTLSKEWRYKWTKIPEVEFDEDSFELHTGKNQLSVLEQTYRFPSLGKLIIKMCRFFNAIHQFLLLHQGPIHEFSLITRASETCLEIDQIISHLARKNTVKEFTLHLNFPSEYRIPSSIFLLHQLTYLYLHKGDIYLQQPFNGFHKLKTLCLHDVNISTKSLSRLLSSCPVLKSFSLFLNDCNIVVKDNCNILELLQSLPTIENLTTDTWTSQCFIIDMVPQVLPTSLVRLKYLCIEDMCMFDEMGIPFLMVLIKCSPNLKKLNLEIFTSTATDPEIYENNPITLEGYSDIWLEHLNVLNIENFVNLKIHIEFVKLILTKSPMLKKVSIWLYDEVTKDEESNISKILFGSPRASPLVQIFVKRSS